MTQPRYTTSNDSAAIYNEHDSQTRSRPSRDCAAEAAARLSVAESDVAHRRRIRRCRIPVGYRLPRVVPRLLENVSLRRREDTGANGSDAVALCPPKRTRCGCMTFPVGQCCAASLHALQQSRDVRQWVELQQQMDVCLHDSHGVHAGSFLMGHGHEVTGEKLGDGEIDCRLPVPCGPDEVDVDPIAHTQRVGSPGSTPMIRFMRVGSFSRGATRSLGDGVRHPR